MSDDQERFAGRRPIPAMITAADVEHLMDAMAALRSHAIELAEHRRHMFTSYVGVGFSEAQALELCKALP